MSDLIFSLIPIFVMGGCAGFIDAIAGGSGLIMVPAFMFSGLDPHVAVATNKLCNTAGSFTSAIRYARAGHADLWTILWLAGPAVLFSWLGSQAMTLLTKDEVEPLIATLLVAVTLITILKPSFGTVRAASLGDRKFTTLTKSLLLGFGALIGFHDGFFGPGAGIFFTFSIIWISSLDFLQATACSKIVNLMTSLIALISFACAGKVNFQIGGAATLGIIAGSYLGAGFAAQKGTRFVRIVFACMAFAVLTKLMILPRI